LCSFHSLTVSRLFDLPQVLNREGVVGTKMRYAIEVAGDTATVYINGELAATDAFALNRACGELSPQVRTLRLDLHGVKEISDLAIIAVRAIMRYWRESRAGNFRLALASEHMVATYAAGSLALTTPRHITAPEASPAQTGMYL
jgi:hypothetical protein